MKCTAMGGDGPTLAAAVPRHMRRVRHESSNARGRTHKDERRCVARFAPLRRVVSGRDPPRTGRRKRVCHPLHDWLMLPLRTTRVYQSSGADFLSG